MEDILAIWPGKGAAEPGKSTKATGAGVGESRGINGCSERILIRYSINIC